MPAVISATVSSDFAYQIQSHILMQKRLAAPANASATKASCSTAAVQRCASASPLACGPTDLGCQLSSPGAAAPSPSAHAPCTAAAQLYLGHLSRQPFAQQDPSVEGPTMYLSEERGTASTRPPRPGRGVLCGMGAIRRRVRHRPGSSSALRHRIPRNPCPAFSPLRSVPPKAGRAWQFGMVFTSPCRRGRRVAASVSSQSTPCVWRRRRA